MKLENVRNRDQFIEYLDEHIPKDKLSDLTVPEAADFFVAYTNARMILDSYRTKDLAFALLEGMPEIQNNNIAHEEFFLAFFEDADNGDDDQYNECIKEALENLKDLIADHFGLTSTSI